MTNENRHNKRKRITKLKVAEERGVAEGQEGGEGETKMKTKRKKKKKHGNAPYLLLVHMQQ